MKKIQLSPQDLKRQKARTNYVCIVNLRRQIIKDFWQLATMLKLCRDEKYWEIEQYDSFEAYCAMPEIDITRSAASKLIISYEVWVLKYGHKIEELDVGKEKLYLTAKEAKDDPDNQEEWLERARTLSRSDLRSFTSGGYKQYKTVQCPNCNFRFEIKKGEDITCPAS